MTLNRGIYGLYLTVVGTADIDWPVNLWSSQGVMTSLWRHWPKSRRVLLLAVYLIVVLAQLYWWPMCEDNSSYSLAEDIEDEELDLPPMPSNLLDPPMWNHKYHSGTCGTWQKHYTTLHRAIMAGESQPAYLVYTTGGGFPPISEGIPQALKGIGTVFMMALLTDRAFVLDWKTPAGFDDILSPRYIDWKGEKVFKDGPSRHHIHDIGSPSWFDQQNHSVEWYMNTDLREYFTEEVEVIQSHSYDFTYALLHNHHFKHKIRMFGLQHSRCKLCCIWHYLFKFSQLFQRNMNSLVKSKLRLSKANDLIFLNIPILSDNLPRKLVLRFANNTVNCARRISENLKKPIWVLASNHFAILEELPKVFSKFQPHAVFYTQEQYLIDLQRHNATKSHHIKVPRTEHNALMSYFLGLFLQLNSTLLFSHHHSPYSEVMAGYRYFYNPSGRYVVYPEQGCQMQRYRY